MNQFMQFIEGVKFGLLTWGSPSEIPGDVTQSIEELQTDGLKYLGAGQLVGMALPVILILPMVTGMFPSGGGRRRRR